MTLPPTVFFSYSHVDEGLRDQIEKQLAILKRQGFIETWHDRRIEAGAHIDHAISEKLEEASIILLLVSPDFLASDYCYDMEMQRALERHQAGEAVVIPVILRACDWHNALFGRLNAVPRDGKPIKQWPDIDEAMLQVAVAVRSEAERIAGQATSGARNKTHVKALPVAADETLLRPQRAGPRSSNLGLAKTFSARERDRFRDDAFEFIKRFFENSLVELGERNPGYEGVFRHVDANRFQATIYKVGQDLAKATVFLGGDMARDGISYVQGHTTSSNQINESLSVDADDQTMYLRNLGMFSYGSDREKKLSFEGSAELLWEHFIRPLQQSRSY